MVFANGVVIELSAYIKKGDVTIDDFVRYIFYLFTNPKRILCPSLKIRLYEQFLV